MYLQNCSRVMVELNNNNKKIKKNSFCHSFSIMGISHFCNRYKETADLLVGHKNCLEPSLAILARNASLRKQ